MHRIRDDFNNVDDHNVPGGDHSHIWPIRVCAAEQGLFFKDLSLNQGIHFTIKRLFGLEAFQGE